MFKAFQKYGKVVDVVIPAKRDKRGRRFGFARFINVEDPKLFGIKLDNIIIGARKIYVNAPRYERGTAQQRNIGGEKKLYVWKEKKRLGMEEASNERREEEEKIEERIRKKVMNEGPKPIVRKWSDVVKDSRPRWKGNQRNYGTRQEWRNKRNFREAEFSFEVAKEEMEIFYKMYVGVVKVPGSTHMIQDQLNKQGFFLIKATPLGANKVLLEEMEEGIMDVLLSGAEDWVHGIFEKVRKWSHYEVDNERLVWARCHGVPVHAWNQEFFTKVVRSCGELVGVDENTKEKSSMDIARLLIRAKGFEVINMVVSARINGSLFHVKLVEEWCWPLCGNGITGEDEGVKRDEDEDSLSSGDSDDGPPLFTAEESGGGWGRGESSDEEDERVAESENIVSSENHALLGKGNNDCSQLFTLGKEKNVGIEVSGIAHANCVGKGVNANQLLLDEKASNVHMGLESDEEISATFNSKIQKSYGGEKVETGGVIKKVSFLVSEYGKKKYERGECSLSRRKLKRPNLMGGYSKLGPLSKRAKRTKNRIKRKKKNQIEENATSEEIQNSNRSGGNHEESARSLEGVVRHCKKNCNMSLSDQLSKDRPVMEEESVGDSGIRASNERWKGAYETMKAKRLWEISKLKLGVSGEDEDEAYVEIINKMEQRDQVAVSRKEKNSNAK